MGKQNSVAKPPKYTSEDVPPKRVIEAARAANLNSVIIIGRTPDGALYAAASESDVAHVLFDIELASRQIMALVELHGANDPV